MFDNSSKVVDLCGLLYPAQCCHLLLVDLMISDSCAKEVISKTLGYGIIAGSTLVKMPQLVKILNARSGVGISFAGVFLELIAMSFMGAYAFANQFPFSSWGETLFLMIVTAGIAFLVLHYQSSSLYSFAFLLFYVILEYALMSGLTPLSVLWVLQALTLPLAISGKLIQVWTNYRNGHTGQLSVITASLLFLGSFARIFTSIQETGDQLVIITFAAASAVNFLLLLQIILYWNQTNAYIKTTHKKKL